MSTLTEAAAVLAQCPICERRIGSHHADGCKHWGQVLPSECPGLVESAIADVLAKRELDEKIARAREEQRAVDLQAIRRQATLFPTGSEQRLVLHFSADEIAKTPLDFEPLRIHIEELKADLATAAKVTEELVDGLSEETRKRQVAEVEAARFRELVVQFEAGLTRGAALPAQVLIQQARAALANTSEPAPAPEKCAWCKHLDECDGSNCGGDGECTCDAPVKCATFAPETIPADVRAKMEADRKAAEEQQRGAAGDRCEVGNNCGRAGCPECQQ